MYNCIRHVFWEDLGGVSLSKPTLHVKKHLFLAYWLHYLLLIGSQPHTLFIHCFLSKDLQWQSEASTSLCYLVFLYLVFHLPRTLALILYTYLILVGNFNVSIPTSLLNLAVSKTCNCSVCAYALPVCHGDCLCSRVFLNTFTVDDKFYILSKKYWQIIILEYSKFFVKDWL